MALASRAYKNSSRVLRESPHRFQRDLHPKNLRVPRSEQDRWDLRNNRFPNREIPNSELRLVSQPEENQVGEKSAIERIEAAETEIRAMIRRVLDTNPMGKIWPEKIVGFIYQAILESNYELDFCHEPAFPDKVYERTRTILGKISTIVHTGKIARDISEEVTRLLPTPLASFTATSASTTTAVSRRAA